MNTTWLEHYRSTYYELLSPEVSGAKRLLVEGIYKRAIGFDIMFRLLLNQRRENFSIIETGTLRTPGNWKDGDDVIIPLSVQDEAVIKEKYPKGYRSPKPYLRITPQPNK